MGQNDERNNPLAATFGYDSNNSMKKIHRQEKPLCKSIPASKQGRYAAPVIADDDPPVSLRSAHRKYYLCQSEVIRFCDENGLDVTKSYTKKELQKVIAKNRNKNLVMFGDGLRQCGLITDKETL